MAFIGGGLGVRLFFVLSGFLITGILLRERAGMNRNTDERGFLIRRFYIRRALRLTPIYYLTLILMAALNVPNTRETFWWHVCYLSNVNFALTNSWQKAVAPFWTLAVEEQFYLFWPLALLFTKSRKLLITAACLVPGAIVYRWISYRCDLAEIPMWVLPPYSMDALLLGALIAISVKEGRLTSRHGLCLALALGGFVIWFVSIFHSQAGDILSCASQTGCALFLGWVVLRASESGSGLPWRILQNSILTYIGKISYGIYVLHNLVAFAFRGELRNLFSTLKAPFAPIAVALSLMAISIGISAISWHLLEAPINRYRRSFTYRR